MPSLINNDTVNNITYLNYFDALTNGEINTQIDTNSVNVRNACTTRWGAGTCGTGTFGGSGVYTFAFPNSPSETKISRSASSTNYRIAFLPPSMGTGVTTGTNYNRLNSSTSTAATVVIVGANPPSNLGAISNSYEYAIVTNNAVTVAGFASSGAALNTATWRFISCGWLSDTGFSPSAINRSLYSLFFNQSFVTAFRVSAEDQTTAQSILVSGNAQYPITCASNTGDGTTPGANLWGSDLWLRDTTSEYGVGRIPHVLLAKGPGFILGNLYYNPTVIDGITNQKIWLCCANYGADKLLMRVYTEGIS